MRDILINQLHSLGMDPEDISRVFSTGGITPRHIRNRLNETPKTMQSEIAKMCHEIMKLEREKAGEILQPRRPNRIARRPQPGPRVYRQLMLFDLEALDEQ